MNRQEAHSNNIKRDKLFPGICLAILPTAFPFIPVSNILHQLEKEFILTNADVGYIGGAALWGQFKEFELERNPEFKLATLH